MHVEDVVSYPEVMVRLGLPGDQVPVDRMETLIRSATRQLESASGSYFVRRAYTEPHDLWRHGWRGQQDLQLDRRPISAVLSIVDLEGYTVSGDQYYVLGDQGILRHKSTWPAPQGTWLVTVSGGWFAETASVDEDVKRAACMLIQRQVDRPSGQGVSSERVGSVSVTYATPTEADGGGVPSEVMDLLVRYRTVQV